MGGVALDTAGKPAVEPPRVWEIVDCYDCGLVTNRVDEARDQTQSGQWFVDNLCVECAASTGPFYCVVEVEPVADLLERCRSFILTDRDGNGQELEADVITLLRRLRDR